MTKSGKCLWVVDTLLREGELSLRELNERWKRSSLYDGKRLRERTFSRYKDFIATEYNIDIAYSASTNKYYIENREEVQNNALYRYLLSAYRVADLNTQALRHRDHMMFKPVTTGTEHLAAILQAIDRVRTVRFSYCNYYDPLEKAREREVIPCFLRIFGGRWYLIGEETDRSAAKVFALERMREVEMGDAKLAPSPEITSEEYYAGCYDVIRGTHKPRLITLRADSNQREYLRAQPFHTSQEEVHAKDEYSDFELYVRPEFDFYQKILWMREKVEVLSPTEMREDIAALIEKMAAKYK